MKHFISALSVVCALVFSIPSPQARTAADFFVSAPDEVLILIPPATRMDMLDYFNNNLPTASPNVVGGTARVLANQPDLIEMTVGRDSNVKIAVVPEVRDTLIAVIETVLTPVPDSYVKFYTRNWYPIKYSTPAMPSVMDFVPRELRKDAAKTVMPDVCFVVADYNPESRTFTMSNTTASYYTDGDRPEGLALMRPSIEMVFGGRKFVEVKPKKSK